MSHRRTIFPAFLLVLACSGCSAERAEPAQQESAQGEVAADPAGADRVLELIAFANEAVAAGDTSAARDYLADAARADTTDPTIRVRLARVSEAIGDTNAALTQYQRALALGAVGPDAAEARQRITALDRVEPAERVAVDPAPPASPRPAPRPTAEAATERVATAPARERRRRPARTRPAAERPTTEVATRERQRRRAAAADSALATTSVPVPSEPTTVSTATADTATKPDSATEVAIAAERRRRNAQQTATGAAAGALAGAVLGGVIDKSKRGVAIGAGVGAILGATTAEIEQSRRAAAARRAEEARRDSVRRADSVRAAVRIP